MARIIRFRQAEEDLFSIANYIAADSSRAAALWLDKIENTIALIAANPFIGEQVDRIRPGLRRVTQGNYVVFYEPRGDEILIVRILHGARRIEDLL